MAKFCVKCGKPLVEGEPCSSCVQGKGQQNNVSGTNTASAAAQTGKEIADQTLNEAKNVFQKIVHMIKDPGRK